jgi:hypothetical protein
MKLLFIILLFAIFFSSANAQQPLFPPTSTDVKKYKGGITTVTTKKGEWSPLNMLSSDYKAYKIRLQDSINNSNFEARFYMEEYNRDSSRIKDRAFFHSEKSKFVCEVISDTIKSDSLILLIMAPGVIPMYYIQGKENKRFKWKYFSGTPLDKDVPVFFIYEENKGEDLLEQKINKLFETPAFKKLKTKSAIVDKIKPIIDSFYFFYYDII